MSEASSEHVDGTSVEGTSGSNNLVRVKKSRQLPDSIQDSPSRLSSDHLLGLIETYPCLSQYNPSIPEENERAHPPPSGKIALYKSFLTVSNLRVPFTPFFMKVLSHYKVSIAQLHPFGVGKIVVFEMILKALGHPLSLYMFRKMFLIARKGDWYTFNFRDNKREKLVTTPAKVPLWRFDYFFVDDSFIPDGFRDIIRLGRGNNSKAMNIAVNSEVNAKVADALIDRERFKKLLSISIPYQIYPEGMLAMAGVSPDWDWAKVPVLKMKSTGQSLSLMDGLNYDLSKYDVEAASDEDAFVLRSHIDNIIPTQADGYEGSLLPILEGSAAPDGSSRDISSSHP